ncbi:DUF6387 family protein [Paraburkholderia tropica]|uniref:DUF6387 family protein n=1 Tax=Paraburkholderia tropica TaxID=92647 RepID=UPI002ABDB580|nr:DUF6387 family protein [Paraburkholderia tropica]
MTKTAAVQLSDLPTSFALEKYDACASFSIADWHNNLMQRALRRNTAADYRDHHIDELKRAANDCLQNPIFPARELQEGDGFEKNVFRSQIRDQTAFELLTGGSTLAADDERARAYRDAFTVMDREMHGEAKYDQEASHAYETLDVPAWTMLNDIGINMSGAVTVNVDLFASDDKLVDDFKAWLRVTRRALNIPSIQRRFTRADFDRWQQNKVLAFLDLSFWADINGLRLTNQILGVALFPEEYTIALADRIRKVVAPLALAASSPVYIEALLSQALEEAEQK